MSRPATLAPAQGAGVMGRGLVLLFAFCCGVIVANIYYAQPIIELIAPDIGLSAGGASLIVSLTQVGYALGLFFLVPLADLLENRRLMLATLAVTVVGLIGAGLSEGPGVLLVTSLLIGFGSVSVQMLIPLAAHLAPEETRGRVVGAIMGGLLLGILLARPVSSLIADHFQWRAVFFGAAAAMLLIALVVATTLPSRRPDHRASYAQLLFSLGQLFRREPVLRQRALYQGLMFAAFSLFWTAAPLALSREYGLSQSQIALFALAGAIGAVAAPIAGRLADAGHTRSMSALAMALGVLGFLPGVVPLPLGVVGLAITGIVLDFAVQMNMVLGQRAVYSLDPASRGRLNALYMTSIFVGGATGSSVASMLYEHAGWLGIAALGSALSLVALLAFARAEIAPGAKRGLCRAD
ncbi:MFS transporter [Azotobacter chroococcum]|uniref:Putative MFS family arabinose efflux permease n=1 Tax=Azotobacter chroococcum TaxID=353 RepID=A0A4R1Q2J5_9GAMM|nr:MFS transporter [Azotobacter chroococcum]TCL34756.1 putative MFS family arabinose efflux permease [Azotobacter chroococcum]